MRQLFTVAALVLSFSSYAFHIVGGEIEFLRIDQGLYTINVVQYFDQAQDENPGPEGVVEVYIYSNKDNSLVSRHLLEFLSQEPVDYTNPECAIDELVTSKVIWTADSLELNPLDYADQEGYYIVWERCCRNENIVNILNPGRTGMKYVLEIPPLWKDDEEFINSSPELFRPLSDYACVNQLYYIDFTGVDSDGDSLSYSLSNPLNTVTQVAVPIPQPKPHIIKNYAPGYEDIIPGSPSLAISDDGLLTVKPEAPGLYVFSVLIKEYRDGDQIGAVRRDFQMLVIDSCEPPDPPVVGINISGRPGFQPETDTLFYALEEDKCSEFFVTNITNGETINLRAEGVNFDNEISEIFEFKTSFVDGGNDTLRLEVCMPGCPPLRDEPFIVDLIAGDDACPLPQLDTLRMTVRVEPPPNQLPQVTVESSEITIPEDDSFSNLVEAVDPDGDFMQIYLEVENIEDPSTIGLTIDTLVDQAGFLRASIDWNTDCLIYDFSEYQQFSIKVMLEDEDVCEYPNDDFQNIDYTVVLPPNNKPRVFFPGRDDNSFRTDPNESLSFEVAVEDVDGDEVVLDLINERFLSRRFGLSFAESTGIGTAQSTFRWTLDCAFLEEGVDNVFEVKFQGDDFDKCKVKNLDTIEAEIRVFVPENIPPEFDQYQEFELEVNEPFTLPLTSTDVDEDTVYIDFSPAFRKPESPSLSFDRASGFQRVTSELQWTPECDLLQNGQPAVYELVFISFDNGCPVTKYDTTRISFLISETRELFDDFLPPNAFSPNGDGINELFTMSGFEERSKNLPADNCEDRFQYVSIHDRSGKRVFYSEEMDFSWDGGALPTGVYYYLVKYTRSEFRNFIQLIR